MEKTVVTSYTIERRAEIQDILTKAYTSFPASLLLPIKGYENALEANDYFRALKNSIDFFEISIQFLTGVIVALLSRNQSLKDDLIKKILIKLFQKTLSNGDWFDIFISIIDRSNEILSEEKLIKTLHLGLFETNKNAEFKNIFINIRNTQLAHNTLKSNNIYKGLLHKVEPWVWNMLELMLPLAEYHFFTLDEFFSLGDEKLYFVSYDRGTEIIDSIPVNSNKDLKMFKYYLSLKKLEENCHLADEEFIEISPFIIQQRFLIQEVEQKYIYIFQSLKNNSLKRVNFISAHEDANAHETNVFKDEFAEFIQNNLKQVVSITDYEVSVVQEMPLEKYAELLSIETQVFVSSQIKSKKFDQELFIDRRHLSESFLKFLESNSTGLVILGNAGTGKTNQLCHWASQTGNRYFALAFNSKIFQGITLKKKLNAVFTDSRTIPEILESLENALAGSGKIVCILFDAINECNNYLDSEKGNGAIKLLIDVNNSIVKRNFKHIKTVISCRTYTWEELLDKDDFLRYQNLYYTVSDREEEYLTLKGFSELEFDTVYPKYASRYRLITSIDKLSEDRYAFVKKRLHDPLILKIASQNFEGRQLPIDLRQFNSTKLFEGRLDLFKNSYNYGEKVGEKLISILDNFAAILWKSFSDNLTIIDLRDSYNNKNSHLHELATQVLENETGRFTTEMRNLIDEGILRVETGWNSYDELRFVYERFNEFMFARQFMKVELTKQQTKGLIGYDAYETILRSSKHSTIIIAALRNALIIDARINQNPKVIIELAKSRFYKSQVLVEETLSVLIEESYNDVLQILERMLSYKREESLRADNRLQELTQLLSRDKKKPRLSESAKTEIETSVRMHKEEIYNVLIVRQISISIIYKIFKSDDINNLLNDDSRSPLSFLWTAMADPLSEVRDTASIYIYYIARYDTKLGMRIISTLSKRVKDTSALALLNPSARRELKQSYIEPACRVSLFIVIDGLIERQDYKLALEILETWKEVVKKFTLNHSIIKLMMPFFKFLFARQTIVQTEYVNNAVEYRHFWDSIKKNSISQEWSREAYKTLLPYLEPQMTNLSSHETLILNGYRSGDSFSLFLLERILIIQGLVNWDNISLIVQRIIQLPTSTPYKPYMEMSLIYSLFQINHKSTDVIQKAESIFADLVYKWTSKHKGYYFSHYNDRANEGRPYKQYVLYWYASAYCNRYGDGMTKMEDTDNVPVFRKLILDAYTKRDKALLYNCLDNMAILVSGSGYYKTALQLFEYLIGLFKNKFEIEEFDNQNIEGRLFAKSLRSFICDMLGTVKSYYPKEVDYFIVNKLKTSQFPDLDAFREEVVNHSLSHEGIGDLLTHKFGNFLIWGIINDQHIRKFFLEVFEFSYDAKDYPEWFNSCIRHIFQELFEVK